MEACMYVCKHACMHARMNVYIYVCMHAFIDLCMYICKQAWTHKWMCDCMFASMHTRMNACICRTERMNSWNFSKSIWALLSKVPLKIKISENEWLAHIEKLINNKNMNFHEDRMRGSTSKLGGTERTNRWKFSKSIRALLSKVPLNFKIFENEWLAHIEKLINNKHMNFHEDRTRGSLSKIGGTEMLMKKEQEQKKEQKEKNRNPI